MTWYVDVCPDLHEVNLRGLGKFSMDSSGVLQICHCLCSGDVEGIAYKQLDAIVLKY